MLNHRNIFRFLADGERAGQRMAIATVTRVEGSSIRDPGTHLAVAQDGSFTGSVSGGCLEAAIAAEAVEVIAAGQPRTVRYGKGSRFIDIRLPCGGAVELLINPWPSTDLARRLMEQLDQRRSVELRLPLDSGEISFRPTDGDFLFSGAADHVSVRHPPPLRLVIAGLGAVVDCLRRLATVAGLEAVVLSPDRSLVDACAADGNAAYWLKSMTQALPFPLDRWSALAVLFHDHDWEPQMLLEAIASDAMYIGAMGSRRTHGVRQERLRALGATDSAIGRIRSPIGILPSLRDPETIAVSTLCQVIDAASEAYTSAAPARPGSDNNDAAAV